MWDKGDRHHSQKPPLRVGSGSKYVLHQAAGCAFREGEPGRGISSAYLGTAQQTRAGASCPCEPAPSLLCSSKHIGHRSGAGGDQTEAWMQLQSSWMLSSPSGTRVNILSVGRCLQALPQGQRPLLSHSNQAHQERRKEAIVSKNGQM